MSNLLLAYTNRADAATLAAGSWSGSFPLANLKDQRLALVARSADTKKASTRLRVKLTANYTLRALAFVNHNFTSAAKWRVRASRASLDLDFTSGAIDERITYTGGANGTRINQRGEIEYAIRTNLAIRSQEFDNAAWTKTGVTVTANQVIAPDGTLTADKALVNATGADRNVYVATPVALTVGVWTVSTHIKVGLNSTLLLGLTDNVAHSANTYFDPASGEIGRDSVGGTNVSILGRRCDPAGNDFYRCTITLYVGAATTYLVQQLIIDAMGGSTGTLNNYMYLWGAQLEAGCLSDYIPTTTAAVTTSAAPRIDYDPSGVVTNVQIRSQEFTDPAGWSVTEAPMVRGFTAPDGTKTATKLMASGTSAPHYIVGSSSFPSGVLSTISVYAKAAEETVLGFYYYGTYGADFSLIGVGSASNVTAGISAKITQLNDGWYRCSISGAAPIQQYPYILLRGQSVTYAGDGISGLYIWGAQLERGWFPSGPSDYVTTGAYPASSLALQRGPIRTNLLAFSQEFDKGAGSLNSWNRSSETGGSIAANTIVAPDGTTTADLYTWPTSTGTFGFLPQVVAGDASRAYTFSIWLKAPSGSPAIVLFISDCSVATLGSSYQSITTGWQRFTFSVAARQLTNTGSIGVAFYGLTAGTVIHLWGAQLEEGAVTTDYIRTNATARTSPQACLGLMSEEARTNLALQSQNFSNASWAKSNLTISAAATTGPFGGSADLVTVTTTASATIAQAGAIVAASTSPHTYTIYAKRSTGTGLFRLDIYNATTAADLVFITYAWDTGALTITGTGTPSANTENLVNGWVRFTITAGSGITAGNALSVYAGATGNALTAGDSWYVWGAQLEASAFATSYIPTGATPVTRTADVAKVDGANLSTALVPGKGTLYAESSLRNRGFSSLGMASLSDTTPANAISLYGGSDAVHVTGELITGSAVQASFSSLIDTATISRVALAYTSNSVTMAASGVVAATDSSAAIPPGLTTLYIGTVYSGVDFFANGHIKRVTYWPEVLTGAELQSITTSGPDAIGYDSGWMNAMQMTFQGDMPSDWGAQYAAMTVCNATTAGYLTVEIDDTANPAGYVQIGRLFAANGFQPAINDSYGRKDRRSDLSTATTTVSGVRYGTTRRRPRGVGLSLGYLTQTEAGRVHEMQAELGTLGEVLYIPDPSDAAYSQRYGFLGYASALSPLDYPFLNNRSTDFQLEEKM
jgi:hypothetical protein